eukprot:TRINITY_DN18055_c0_g1_i2.p1 TRINITY_DN18055_c0_g1~~TRINITY_DN18055_c0_g1_i2.p1  ORF type:complete len:273 (+),score=58.65 TRINITY_DN18055_c0_g1_i2:86-820(+)
MAWTMEGMEANGQAEAAAKETIKDGQVEGAASAEAIGFRMVGGMVRRCDEQGNLLPLDRPASTKKRRPSVSGRRPSLSERRPSVTDKKTGGEKRPSLSEKSERKPSKERTEGRKPSKDRTEGRRSSKERRPSIDASKRPSRKTSSDSGDGLWGQIFGRAPTQEKGSATERRPSLNGNSRPNLLVCFDKNGVVTGRSTTRFGFAPQDDQENADANLDGSGIPTPASMSEAPTRQSSKASTGRVKL